MAFRTLFMAHAPDADCHRHRSVIETGRYRLHTVVVSSQSEAVEVARSIHEEEGLDAVMLCPGFSHTDVSGIFGALDGRVSVSVARGDGPSNRITQPVIRREFFPESGPSGP